MKTKLESVSSDVSKGRAMPSCGALSPMDDKCTRPRFHQGDHEDESPGTTRYARWPRASGEAFGAAPAPGPWGGSGGNGRALIYAIDGRILRIVTAAVAWRATITRHTDNQMEALAELTEAVDSLAASRRSQP